MVCFIIKTSFTVVASLNDMLNASREIKTGQTGHGVFLSSGLGNDNCHDMQKSMTLTPLI